MSRPKPRLFRRSRLRPHAYQASSSIFNSEPLMDLGPRVSVVMATCRRPDLLRRCLDALVDQTLPGKSYEIIVVDDGHTADSKAVVDEFAAHMHGAPAVRYFESQGTRGPAGARNVGWRQANAAIVAFTDDDTVPQRDWLRAGLEVIGDDEDIAVSGRTEVPIDGELTDHARMTQGLESAAFVTANAFVPKELLQEVGGFDERFTRPWREDSDLEFKLVAAGAQIVKVQGAVVQHPVRPAPWGISLGQQANSFFEPLLFKKHRAAYRRTVMPQVPWSYYFIIVSLIAAVVFAVFGPWQAAVLFLVLSLGTIASFALKRLRGASHSAHHVMEMLVTSAAIPFLSVYWRLRGAWHFKVLFF